MSHAYGTGRIIFARPSSQNPNEPLLDPGPKLLLQCDVIGCSFNVNPEAIGGGKKLLECGESDQDVCLPWRVASAEARGPAGRESGPCSPSAHSHGERCVEIPANSEKSLRASARSHCYEPQHCFSSPPGLRKRPSWAAVAAFVCPLAIVVNHSHHGSR